MMNLKENLRPLYYALKGIKTPKRVPDFFVLGATRAGSTYLYNFLDTSPDIFLPQTKELTYFNHDAHYKKSLKNYNTLFRADGTLDYAAAESPIERIARHAPHAKLIISLRDPIARIISIYKKNYAQGKISTSLEEEIQNELAGKPSMMLISRNQYEKHLKTIFRHFPSSQIRIFFFEEWIKDIGSIQNELCDFLEIEAWTVNEAHFKEKAKNTSVSYAQKHNRETDSAELSSETRALIAEKLRPSKAYIEELTGRKIDFWEL